MFPHIFHFEKVRFFLKRRVLTSAHRDFPENRTNRKSEKSQNRKTTQITNLTIGNYYSFTSVLRNLYKVKTWISLFSHILHVEKRFFFEHAKC